MADQLKVEKKLVNDKFTVEAELLPGTSLPAAIFVYVNTGTDVLGEYIGVVDLEETRRYDVWAEAPIKVFGNKYVRHDKMIREYTDEATADSSILHLLKSVRRLKLEIEITGPDVITYDL